MLLAPQLLCCRSKEICRSATIHCFPSPYIPGFLSPQIYLAYHAIAWSCKMSQISNMCKKIGSFWVKSWVEHPVLSNQLIFVEFFTGKVKYYAVWRGLLKFFSHTFGNQHQEIEILQLCAMSVLFVRISDRKSKHPFIKKENTEFCRICKKRYSGIFNDASKDIFPQ